ncbi:MAG: hypothetical protein JNM56_26480 [Planctomycetia bacterium]|nr:hypothetical protein [Planctomycetia bacterium]
MSLRGLTNDDIRQQAEQGDLRPQFNRHSVLTWDLTQLNGSLSLDELQRILLNRFFELSRPIANACHEPGLNMRLSDSARFFYLVESLEHCGCRQVEDTLLVLLDEFSQLEQRSYDELYLWSIVELSRRRPEYVERFWPLVLTLDLRFRAEPWQRPENESLVDEPYRLFELLVYYFVIYTRVMGQVGEARLERNRRGFPERVTDYGRRYPPLATYLRRFARQLDEDQMALLLDTLRPMSRQLRRPEIGDAFGVLLRDRERLKKT